MKEWKSLLEKSKNNLDEKYKNGQAKNLHKKEQHVYNNCYNFVREQLKKNEIGKNWKFRKTL